MDFYIRIGAFSKKNLMDQTPSLGSCEVTYKIWVLSVKPFWRILNTSRQKSEHPDRQAKYRNNREPQFKKKSDKKLWYFVIFTQTKV